MMRRGPGGPATETQYSTIGCKRKKNHRERNLDGLSIVGVTRFELATPWSQTRCSSQTEPHPEALFSSDLDTILNSGKVVNRFLIILVGEPALDELGDRLADVLQLFAGVWIVALEAQHLVEVALCAYLAEAFGIDEAEDEGHVADHEVDGSARVRAVDIARMHHVIVYLIGDGRGTEGFLREIIDLAAWGFAVYTQDIDFICIPQDRGEAVLALAEILREAVHVVEAYRLLEERKHILLSIAHEETDLSIPEEDIRAQHRMITGQTVLEGVVLAELLEAADVMEHTAEPGEITVGRGQSEIFRDCITHRRDPVGVVHLQLHLHIA